MRVPVLDRMTRKDLWEEMFSCRDQNEVRDGDMRELWMLTQAEGKQVQSL